MNARYVVFYDEVAAQATVDLLSGRLGSNFQLCWLESDDEAEELAKGIDADFLLAGWRPIDKRLVETGTKLRGIHKLGAGVDKIPLAAAKRRGIPVTASAGLNAAQVAEHTIMLILATLRRLPSADSAVRGGAWPKNTLRPVLRSLRGQTVGIIGLGHIGHAVAERLAPFGVQLCYHDARRAGEAAERRLAITYRELPQLLRESTVITVHVPLTEATRGLIGPREIGLMSADTVLVNTSRGPVIDQAALSDALASGRLWGAGLDVFCTEPPRADDRLLISDRVTLTPHVAGSSRENVAGLGDEARAVFEAILAGQDPPGRVN